MLQCGTADLMRSYDSTRKTKQQDQKFTTVDTRFDMPGTVSLQGLASFQPCCAVNAKPAASSQRLLFDPGRIKEASQRLDALRAKHGTLHLLYRPKKKGAPLRLGLPNPRGSAPQLR